MADNTPLKPLLLSTKEVIVLLGIGRRTLTDHMKAGLVPRPIRLAGRVLWDRQDLEKWIAAGAPPRAEWEAMKGGQKETGRAR
jgi:predicted DNA-binding transcriptional regulator AlpA